MSILNVNISCFANYNTPHNPRTVNMLDWLKSDKYAEKAEQISQIKDKAERDRLKATLPAITPSGIFTSRRESCIVQYSGLMQIDVDWKDNMHVKNFKELKHQLANIQNFAYIGLSVSRIGFWALIPIKYPAKHKLYFFVLQKLLLKYGIRIDPAPKNIASLRGYSYDPDAYFNHNATTLTLLDGPQPVRGIQQSHYGRDNGVGVVAILERIKRGRIDITNGYDAWLRIGFALANEFGETGRQYFHEVSKYHPDYDINNADSQYTSCLKSNGQGITIATFFHIAKINGITNR